MKKYLKNLFTREALAFFVIKLVLAIVCYYISQLIFHIPEIIISFSSGHNLFDQSYLYNYGLAFNYDMGGMPSPYAGVIDTVMLIINIVFWYLVVSLLFWIVSKLIKIIKKNKDKNKKKK